MLFDDISGTIDNVAGGGGGCFWCSLTKNQSKILGRVFGHDGGKEDWIRQSTSFGGLGWSGDELTAQLMAAEAVTGSFGFWADRDPLF
jgi:hypothetical protein